MYFYSTTSRFYATLLTTPKLRRFSAEGKETTIIADVHTDTNPPRQVLEKRIGYVDLILVVYKLPGVGRERFRSRLCYDHRIFQPDT